MTLLVPYRDRPEQLAIFLPVLISQGHKIILIEQCDNKPFNRGKLINIGFIETPTIYNMGSIVVHDIDMIPYKVDYSETHPIIQLAGSDIQKHDYLGGVTLFHRYDFSYAGGYHNDFWHRAEDNEMMFNLKKKGLRVFNKLGTFVNLPHSRPRVEFDPVLWLKAQQPRTVNMLETCQYEAISKELHDGYTHLRVLL